MMCLVTPDVISQIICDTDISWIKSRDERFLYTMQAEFLEAPGNHEFEFRISWMR
jgi:hypothetical protein